MNIKNRVKELRNVAASDLRPNPKNWRTHPEAQRNALRGILAEVGIAAACLARELPDGSLMLIDGHLRAETAAGATVPVLILDVNEEEADKILATLDPLAAMADTDSSQLAHLLESLSTNNEALKEMLASLSPEGLLQEQTAETLQPVESKNADTDRDYGTSSIRQIILVFENKDYEKVIAALSEHAEKFGLSNNTEVILHLLETNGYAVSRRDSA